MVTKEGLLIGSQGAPEGQSVVPPSLVTIYSLNDISSPPYEPQSNIVDTSQEHLHHDPESNSARQAEKAVDDADTMEKDTSDDINSPPYEPQSNTVDTSQEDLHYGLQTNLAEKTLEVADTMEENMSNDINSPPCEFQSILDSSQEDLHHGSELNLNRPTEKTMEDAETMEQDASDINSPSYEPHLQGNLDGLTEKTVKDAAAKKNEASNDINSPPYEPQSNIVGTSQEDSSEIGSLLLGNDPEATPSEQNIPEIERRVEDEL